MLAELVAEAFSKEIARQRIEKGQISLVQGSEIDGYNSSVNSLMLTVSRAYPRST